MTPTTNTPPPPQLLPQTGHLPIAQSARGWARWAVWLAGLAVALGAGVATAHGLYEVALAAGTPRVLAWLYPLITDGLALVAYATTTRLSEHGRRYAWIVVVVAAGLSGLTQASYLAGGVRSAPPALRFAIGAWPAIAAAIVAHLLYLLGTHTTQTRSAGAADDSQLQPPGVPHPSPGVSGGTPGQPSASQAIDHSQPQLEQMFRIAGPVLPGAPDQPLSAATGTAAREAASPGGFHAPPAANVVRSSSGPGSGLTDSAPTAGRHAVHRWPVQPAVQPGPPDLRSPSNEQSVEQPVEHPKTITGRPVVRVTSARDAAPARVRAQTAATGYATRHGALPTVSELMALAQVARGTAAAALKDLRQQPTQPGQLHITRRTDNQETDR